LLTASVQVAVWQMLFTQWLLLQSLEVAQPAESRHGPQAAPPQSVSVSVPFRCPSLQPGAAQTKDGEQYPDVQSAPVMQAPPSGQSPHEAPPQSVSVSVALRTPSVHVATWHTSPTQTRLAQSLDLPHPWPAGQGPHAVPPQSCPVSLPFFTPSVHAGS
jgi:hypothetical protein